MEYDNKNRGAIWKNDKQETENHPDFKGSLNVEGIEYWVSAWKRKEGANPNAPALSFNIQPKEPVGGHGERNDSPEGEDFSESDIDF
jgi:hypothetical protein